MSKENPWRTKSSNLLSSRRFNILLVNSSPCKCTKPIVGLSEALVVREGVSVVKVLEGRGPDEVVISAPKPALTVKLNVAAIFVVLVK